jgi:tripartite ATP-independent transporter DctM subunit
LALVAVSASVFFTCLTGASGVAILALGGLLMPMLLASGYRDRDALGLVTGAGTAGVLTPPSMPLILYAVVAQVGIEQMFFGSLLPALVMAALTLAWGLLKAPQGWGAQQSGPTPKISRAAWDAKWELLLPIVALGSLFGGFATPVEAAALTALYALLIQTMVHRELTWRHGVPRVFTECGLLVGGVLLILGVAQGLTNFIIDMQIPDLAVDWVAAIITSPWVFLLALNGLLLVAGCLVDVFSAIIILTPMLAPVGAAYGIDPIHLGVIILANLELGYLTPPVGMNLFYAAYRFKRPILEVGRSVLSLFAMLALGVLAITFIPWLSNVLVR